jgi:hypothetical protein
MEVLVFHQQKAWAAKGITIPPDASSIPDPLALPPKDQSAIEQANEES